MLTSRPLWSTCKSLPAMSLNSTPARWHNRFGRPRLSRYEPAPSPPASDGCLVSECCSIAPRFPQPRDDSFLLLHHPQFPEFSQRSIPAGALPPAIAPRSAHPGLVHLVALPPAPLGHRDLYYPPLPSAPRVGGTGLDRRSPRSGPLSPAARHTPPRALSTAPTYR